MTVKPVLLAASPGHVTGYVVTNGDYNNDTLQLGNYVEEVLAGTNTDKIPDSALLLVQPAWTVISTFTNAWVDASGTTGMATVRYRKDTLGGVHLQGSIKSGTGATNAFNIPVGFRPIGALPRVPVGDASTNGTATVSISTAGDFLPLITSVSGLTFNLYYPTT